MDDFSDPKLQMEHLNLIKSLAEETHHSLEEVDKVYSATFDALNAEARIKNYLALLTSKKVREALHR